MAGHSRRTVRTKSGVCFALVVIHKICSEGLYAWARFRQDSKLHTRILGLKDELLESKTWRSLP